MLFLTVNNKRFSSIAMTVLISASFIVHNSALATSYQEITKIDKQCQASSNECLKVIDDALSSLIINSRPWAHLKLLQLDALFNLQKFDALAQELTPLIANDNLPVNFSVYVYIYHAKLLLGNQEKDLAQQYLAKAVSLLNEINDKYPEPVRLIEIANVQIVLKDYQQANKTLLQLELKFKDRYHPVFKRELYANLGHIAYFQDEKALHIRYREKSLEWAIEANNNQQVGIAYSNLAVAFRKAGNYQLSEQNYKQAVKISQVEQDDINGAISNIRLIEVILLQGKDEEAKKLFNAIPLTSTVFEKSAYYSEIYQALKLTLK